MNRYLRLTNCAVLLILGWLSTTQAQTPPSDWATITGQVLDAQGQPVSGAKIAIFPAGSISGGLPVATTGKDGRYRLVSPPYGKAWLSAVKESAGYPDVNGLLFSSKGESRPEVFLAPSGIYHDVDLHLGQPYGIVEGSILDAKTGTLIKNARILLHREEPLSMYSTTVTDGHFLFALPPAPITISITAPGFLPWKYSDAQNGNNTLTLNSSDHQVMNIELTPSK